MKVIKICKVRSRRGKCQCGETDEFGCFCLFVCFCSLFCHHSLLPFLSFCLSFFFLSLFINYDLVTVVPFPVFKLRLSVFNIVNHCKGDVSNSELCERVLGLSFAMGDRQGISSRIDTAAIQRTPFSLYGVNHTKCLRDYLG